MRVASVRAVLRRCAISKKRRELYMRLNVRMRREIRARIPSTMECMAAMLVDYSHSLSSWEAGRVRPALKQMICHSKHRKGTGPETISAVGK
jgi:hypothetical protein